MAEITKPDLITQEAADTFKDLAKDAISFKDTLEGIRSSSKAFSESINDNNTTASKLRETVGGLSDDQKALNQVQNQIAAQNAKLTDTYQAQAKVLADLKDKVKLTNELGDRAAISITKENASRQQLGVALAANQKAYSLLTSEQQRQAPQGQQLLKVIQDQFKGYDELSKSIGRNQQNVGKYELATEGLKGQFEGLLGKLGPAGEKIEEIGSKALSAGQLIKGAALSVGGLVTAAGAFIATSIAAYFTRTAAGAKELFEVTTDLEYAWIQTKNIFADVGQALVEAFKAQPAIILLSKAKQAIESEGAKEYRENALEGRALQKDRIELTLEESTQELEKNRLIFESRDALLNSQKKRLEADKEALKIQQELAEAATKQAEAEAKQKGFAIAIESGRFDGTKAEFEKLSVADLKKTFSAKDFQEIIELYNKINEAKQQAYAGTRRIMAQIVSLEIEIAKQETERQLSLVKTNKDIDNEILQSEISRNALILGNLRSTEQQKKEAYLKDAEDEKKIAQNTGIVLLAQAEKAAIERFKAINGEKADFNKEDVLAADQVFQAERLKIEINYTSQKEVIDLKLKQDLLKNEIDFAKRRGDAALLYYNLIKDQDTARLNGIIQTNSKILAADDSSYEARASALKSNAALEIAISTNGLEKEIASAKEASKQKIAADGLKLQHEKELEAQIEVLQDNYENKVKAVNQKLLVDTKVNVFTTLARDATVLNEKVKIEVEKNLIDLNEKLHSGAISATAYEAEKARIIISTENKIAQNEIDNLEEQKKLVIKEGVDTQLKLTDIEAKEAAIREAMRDRNNQTYLDRKKKLFQQEVALANAALDAIDTISKNETDSKIQNLENQLASLQENHDKQITLAGDNAEAKKQIDLRFAQEQKKIQKEEAKLKHDQAVRDKELSEAKILINTAVAVSETIAAGGYFAIPLAVIVGALGALELAKVESTPIPAYYLGTDNHPGGKALVGEQGTELLTLPSGQLKLTPNRATVMDLPSGTEVLPSKETMKVLALAGLSSSQSGNTIPLNMTGVITEIKGLRSDMKNNKPRYPNYARMASGVYELRQESDTHIKRVLALSGNH